MRIAVPGFQPFAAYDVVLANLVPGADRRPPPASVLEVLSWAGTPLATREVAVVCDIGHDEAREQLGRVADRAPRRLRRPVVARLTLLPDRHVSR